MNVLEVVEDRQVVDDHDGRSGARIERGRLPDGTQVFVKTAPLGIDLGAVLTGSGTRERELLVAGTFDRLPDGVAAVLIGAGVVGDDLVTVSRDVSPSMLRWDRTLSRGEVETIFDRAARLHRAFAGAAPDGLCALETRLTLLSPANLPALIVANPSLADVVSAGWERFVDLVPAEVADAVGRVQDDPSRLAAAMATGPQTLLHGDLWLVNVALEQGRLVLLDWGLATLGPPSLDLITFCVGATSNVALSRQELLDAARASCADLVDDTAFAAAELWALVELGWNKAYDATEHPDPAKRATERADLDFWVGRALRALDRGVRP